MNEWKCTVKTPSNWLQTVRVEAYTHSDAVAFAESQTGGKCITAVIDNSYNNSASESNDGAEVNGGLILFGLVVLLLVYAWKWILLIGAISLVIWLVIKYSQE
jgi:hypothetical protein